MEKINLKLETDRCKPLRELVFDTLREAIIMGEIPPGTRMMEEHLAEKLEVSRTPIREAIRQLEREGLVEIAPRRGAYVAGMSPKDCHEVLEIRAALEGLTTELAAQRATKEEVQRLEEIVERFFLHAQHKDIQGLIQEDTAFHEVIYQASRNKRLLQMINGLRDQVQRFRITYISHLDRVHELAQEHQKILEYIAKGDAKHARDIAEHHVRNFESYITDHIGLIKG